MRLMIRSMIVLCAALLSIGARDLAAQATASASLVGIVADSTGAAVANATITAENTATNERR